MKEITIASDEKIVFVGWTDTEKLVCVTLFGKVKIYNLQGELVSEFAMGSVCRK
jgi:hypothetical protein